MTLTQEEDSLFPPKKQRATTRRYLSVHIFSFPFWGLLQLLPIIVYKDLNATPLQVATIIALKPMASLLSPYWSQLVHGNYLRLLPNLYLANILKFLPFLLTPFISNVWYFIVCFGLFMALSRGTIPAWMETLKINLPKRLRDKVCVIGLTIDFLGTALLPIAFGSTLDHFDESWRWLFFGTALLGMISTLFIIKIPMKCDLLPQENVTAKKSPLTHFLAPWRNGWDILSKRSDFSRFQLGFFLGGAGLMIIQPILPNYFVDVLNLSYTGMLTALAACKGIGFTLSSPIWVRFFRRTKIFTLCALTAGLAAIFPFLLASAQTYSLFVYFAYIIYGIMQGGSELSWKMSGVIFANGLDSAPYSSVNVLIVGIRGIIVPYIGSFIFSTSGNYLSPLLIGALLSMTATVVMASSAKKFSPAVSS